MTLSEHSEKSGLNHGKNKMERYTLKKGDTITLLNSETKEPLKLEIISECLGAGNSSVVYEAKAYNSALPCKYRLKELYPESMDELYRDINNELIIPSDCKKEYLEYKKRFDNAAKILWEFAYSDAAGCYTVCPLGRFTGINSPSEYIITQWMTSDSVSTVNFCGSSDLYKTAKICLKTAYAAKAFHEMGYMNLDIKPENILYSEKTDTIAFFDTDTILKMGDCKGLNSQNNERIYFSEGAAPEIMNGFKKLYSGKSDVFSIGSMLHRFITGENYFAGEYSSFSKDFELNPLMLCKDKMNPRAFAVCDKIFSGASPGNPSKRINDDELISYLSELVNIASTESIYIENCFIKIPSDNNDRLFGNDETLIVREKLIKNNYLFIQGLKSSGKTDFARGYAAAEKEHYHTIVFAEYENDIKTTVSKIKFSGIDEENLSKEAIFNIKYEHLKKYKSDTLLIIDNYINSDSFTEEFLESLSVHTLLTTSDSLSYDKNHIYALRKNREQSVNTDEISKFKSKYCELREINRIFKYLFIVLFLSVICFLMFALFKGDRLMDFGDPAIIISLPVSLIFKSLLLKRAETESTARIAVKYSERDYLTALNFASNANLNQVFEIAAPEKASVSESKRHKFRIIIGTLAIFLGVITGILSFFLKSFPFLSGCYSLIILAVLVTDYEYGMKKAKENYADTFLSPGENSKGLYDIYSFESKGTENTENRISPEAARQIIYSEHRTRCNIGGTMEIIINVIAAVVISSLGAKYIPLPVHEYFHLPDFDSFDIFIHIILCIFIILQIYSVAFSHEYFDITKDLLFVYYSSDGAFILEKYRDFTNEGILSKTSVARGIYRNANIKFDRGIPIYEIRRSERPTFNQFCITQSTRVITYYICFLIIELSIIWHFYAYTAFIPMIISNALILIIWFLWGMKAYNKKILGIKTK